MVHNDQPGTGTLIYPAGRFIAIAVTTCLGAAFVLWINGSVPFLSVPTLQLALWASGFAQPLAQEGWLAVHSTRLGLPEPAAISFGLAAAWPMSVLIRLGMHAADAYATVFAAWLLAAYAGAWVTAVRFGAAPVLATLGAACWLGMPVVWGHAPYTMLSLGIALLPLYFLALLRLLQPGASRANGAVGYLAVTLIAVFMDGYTFVFFASGAGALILYLFVFDPDRRRHLALFVVPWHLAAFAMAYVAYTGYVGTTSFGDHPLSVFRGLGLDLSFLLIPSAGVHWLADLLGWSVSRSDREFFGDWSTWSTTFAVPVMVVAIAAWRDARRHDGMATGLLLVAALGLYLALGPSVKFHSTKPESLQRQQLTEERIVRHMSPRFALGPTGNAWLWRHVPGFDSMRATYRWITLCVFACWLLVMLQASRQSAIAAGAIRWYFALSAIILVNLPGPNSAAHQGMRHRAAFLDIDTDLVARLKAETPAGAVVAFLPPGNDFLVNYLASGAGIRT